MDDEGDDITLEMVDRMKGVAVLGEAAETMVERFANDLEREVPDLLLDMAVWLAGRAVERGIQPREALLRFGTVLVNAKHGTPLCLEPEDRLN